MLRIVIPLLTCAMSSAAGAEAPPLEPVPYAVPAALPDLAEVLSPSRIEVGGWLGARIAANEKNRLLVVDTEPLLAGYRQRPGVHPWIGEHVGKWLHAATLAWAYTSDAALRTKLDRVAADLIRCQEPDGYLGTYVPEKRFGIYQGADWDVWSHKYNMIGLLTYYQYTGERPALDCCRKMADLLIATFPARKSILAAGTHVGMAATSVLEPVVLLYRFTGDARYLDFARYIVKSWDEPGGPSILASLRAGKGVNQTANGKAYEMLSNLVGVCELARAAGDAGLLEPVKNAWDDIVNNRLYITGSASAGELFRADHVLPNQPGAHVGETCVTTTWIQLNLQLLRLTGEAKYGDHIERSLYNHLAAAQNPRGDDWCYYTALEGKKPYDPGINCCHSSGPRGMALAALAAYLRGKSRGGESIIVNTLETSGVKLVMDGRDVALEQRSQFPRTGASTITLRMAGPARFGLMVRDPQWARGGHSASGLTLALKGQSIETTATGGYVVVRPREWKDGDQIDVSFSMRPRRVLGRFGNEGKCALVWGPFVLAYDESANPGLPHANRLGLVADDPPFALAPGPNLSFQARVVERKAGEPKAARFVTFADAGSTGGTYRVWLRAPGVEPAVNLSILGDGQEHRSRPGNQSGSINDGDPSSFVVTFDGTSAKEDWYAVTLSAPARIARVVFKHGQNFHDGGWFDARGGKPKVQIQTQSQPDGEWKTVGELTGYPATTATASGGLKPGQAFEVRLAKPETVTAVRVIGTPASGDNPRQRFSSCGELEAFSE